MESETRPKLAVVRKRRKSVKSRIRARANENVKLAALEARKAAALEYVGEQLEELIGLLKAEGFKVSRGREAVQVTQASPVAVAVKNPCTYCGREGVILNETKNGWLCETHGQYEVGGAVQDRAGQTLAQQMLAPKPINPSVAKPKPAGPKMVIHPNDADARASRQPIDPLKGAPNGTANVLGDDSDEAEAIQ
jgi:hypothetical protein